MNYLAHAYLSDHNASILLGNMCSDFIKGKKQFEYPDRIQIGIQLHRFIDQFTDQHPATRHVKSFFQSEYRLYSAAIADVVYDHFLAIDETYFPKDHLAIFAEEVYTQLESQQAWMPVSFAMMFPFMKSENWLYHYQFPTGIEKSLAGLARRARYMPDSQPAFELFMRHYDDIGAAYRVLFPDLVQASEKWRQTKRV